jgi:hypothetical protein
MNIDKDRHSSKIQEFAKDNQTNRCKKILEKLKRINKLS